MSQRKKLLDAVVAFMGQSRGIVCMNKEHDKRLLDARDALYQSMLDAMTSTEFESYIKVRDEAEAV